LHGKEVFKKKDKIMRTETAAEKRGNATKKKRTREKKGASKNCALWGRHVAFREGPSGT
jgi:hypothetical protein